MSSQQVHFNEFIRAPRESVFAFFGNHEKFGRIWPGRTRRIKDGQNPKEPNGLGSVREIKPVGLPAFEETIEVHERPARLEYTVTRGSPIKNHRGVILFTEENGGTRVDYTIRFDPKIPCTGGLIGAVLKSEWARGFPPVRGEIEAGAS